MPAFEKRGNDLVPLVGGFELRGGVLVPVGSAVPGSAPDGAPQALSLNLSASPTSVQEGQVSTLTATPSGGTPDYTVRFYDGDPDAAGTPIGSAQSVPGVATQAFVVQLGQSSIYATVTDAAAAVVTDAYPTEKVVRLIRRPVLRITSFASP